MMAALFSSVCVTVTLLLCVPGSHAVDLLRATSVSGNAPSVPTVQCRCSNYPNATLCTWPEPSQSPPTHYITSCSEREKEESSMECHLVPPGPSSSAAVSAPSSSFEQHWHCHLPNLKLLTNYILNITAVYPAGSSSHLTSFMMEDLVKPDPPANVRISPHGVRNLLMEWSPPPTWANLDIFPLKYHVKYEWDNGGATKFVNLGPLENTAIELKGLTPGRPYLFQVCAEELLGFGECSDWSLPVNATILRAKP